MESSDILVSLVGVVVLGLVLWWVLFRGGADWLGGTWLGMFFHGGIPTSSRGWNADSYKLLVIAMFVVALIALIAKVILNAVGE